MTDGANAEEVLSLGHLFEQGANDNATGVASIIGAAATLMRLIKEGKLPRPKRTIRVLGMSECYGMLHYLEQYKDRAKRTIAAMCIDAPAGKQTLAGTEYTWVLNPQSASSYVDSFVLHVAAEYFPSVGRSWAWSEHHSGTDNYLGDPTIGIPTVLPRGGYGVHAHHNSYDTAALVDPKSLHNLAVMNATYAYFIASAGPAEKRWLAEVAMTNGYTRVAAAAETILDQVAATESADRLAGLLYQGRENIDYSASRAEQAVHSVAIQGVDASGLSFFCEQQKQRVEIAVEERLRNPGGAVVGLIDEIEERVALFSLRPRIGRIPSVYDVPHIRLEAGLQRRARPAGRVFRAARERAGEAGNHEHRESGRAAHQRSVLVHHPKPSAVLSIARRDECCRLVFAA